MLGNELHINLSVVFKIIQDLSFGAIGLFANKVTFLFINIPDVKVWIDLLISLAVLITVIARLIILFKNNSKTK